MNQVSRTRLLAIIAALATVAVALWALALWNAGEWRLLLLGENSVPMAPLTALLFLLLGLVSVAQIRWPDSAGVRRITRVATLTVIVISVLVLLQYHYGFPLPWDGWLVPGADPTRAIPIGRMSLLTAGSFILSAIAVLEPSLGGLLGSWSWRFGRGCALLGLVSSILMTLSYGLNVPVFYGENFVPMALITALGFMTLNGGLLLGDAGGRLSAMWSGAPGEEQISPRRFFRTRKVAAVLALGALAVLLGIGLLRTKQAELHHLIRAQLTAINELKAQDIANWQQERVADARVLAAQPSLVDLITTLAQNPAANSRALERLNANLEVVRTAYHYEQIVLLDRSLQAVLVSPRGATTDLQATGVSVAELAASPAVLIRNLHREADGRRHLDLLAPVHAPESNAFAGALKLTVDVDHFLFPQLERWPVPSETSELLLVQRSGDWVEYLNTPRFATEGYQARLPLSSPELLAAKILRDHPGGLVEGTDYRGVPVFGVARALPGLPWVLVAKIDQAEAYAPLRKELWQILAGCGLLALFTGLFLRTWWQQEKADHYEQRLRVEEEAHAANERLAIIMRHASDVIFVFDEHQRILLANEQVREVYGYTPDEMRGRTVHDLHPPGDTGTTDALFAAAFTPKGRVFETEHRRKDGTVIQVEVTSRQLESEGQIQRIAFVRDITRRKDHEMEISRLNRLYQVISRINQMLVRAKSKEELYAETCRVLVEVGGFRMAWIGEVDPASHLLLPVARTVAGEDTGYIAQLRISIDPAAPEGRGPSSVCFREGRTYVCNDFFTDEATAPWRERARTAGFRSSITLPVKGFGPVLATLAVYSEERNFFSAREIGLLEGTAGDLAFALEVFAGEARRRAVEAELRLLSLAVEQSPASIIITDLRGQIEYVNTRFSEASGFTLDEVRGHNPRLLKSGLTPPDVFEEMWRRLNRGQVWRGELVNRKKSGEIFTEFTVIAPARNAQGVVTHYIGIKEDITERKLAEEKVRQLSRIVDQAPLSIAITDLTGAIEYVNPAFLEATGYAWEEVRGKNPRVLKSGRTPPATYTDMWTTLTRGEVWRGELSNRRKSGELYDELAVIAPVVGELGHVTHYVALKQDITEMKLAAEALRESEARFRELFDLESDAIIVIDTATARIVQANLASSAVYGYSVAEMLALRTVDLSAEPDLTESTHVRAAAALNEVIHIPRRIHRRRDGTCFPVEIKLRSFQRGHQTLAVSVIRDITEQERAREQLQRFNTELEQKVELRTAELGARNREIEALLESIPDLVLRLHADGRVLSCRPAKGATPLTTLVWAPDRESEPPFALLLTAARAAGAGVLQRAAHPGVLADAVQVSHVAETSLPLPGGTLSLELRATAIGAEDYVVFARDITARKRLEAETVAMLERERQVSEMKSRFISVTSHEFRTPMTAIMGSVELLANHLDRLDPAKRAQLFDRISGSLHRMTEMLDDVLLLNRMEAGRTEVRPVQLGLAHFLRNLGEETTLADRNVHRLVLDLPEGELPFRSDPKLLHHIVGNLLSNAMRYSPPGTTVTLRARLEPAELRLSVTDEGIGIPPEDQARIFEAFERGSNVGQIKGTGLGLNIVKRMTGHLGGTITLESAPGRGTTFTLLLPHLPPDPTP